MTQLQISFKEATSEVLIIHLADADATEMEQIMANVAGDLLSAAVKPLIKTAIAQIEKQNKAN